MDNYVMRRFGMSRFGIIGHRLYCIISILICLFVAIYAFSVDAYAMVIFGLFFMFLGGLGLYSGTSEAGIRAAERDKPRKQYKLVKRDWAKVGYTNYLDKQRNKYWNVKYSR